MLSSSHVGGPEGALAAADVGADREGTLVEEVVSAGASVDQSWKVVSGAGCLKGATPLYSRMALFLPLPCMPASGILLLPPDTQENSGYFGLVQKCLQVSGDVMMRILDFLLGRVVGRGSSAHKAHSVLALNSY
jgi:hypothetical protein